MIWKLILLLGCTLAQGAVDKYPIGVIFEQGAGDEMQTAFRYALYLHNRNETGKKIELQAYVDVINTADSFKLSRLICSHLSRGIYALIGVVGPDAFGILHSYSNTFHIPFLTPWYPEKIPLSPLGSLDYALALRPNYYQAVLDVVNYYGWKKLIYVYESNEGLLRLQDIYQSIDPANSSFTIDIVRQASTAEGVLNLLRGLERNDRHTHKYVILDCNAGMAQQVIFGHVKDIHLGRRNFHYLLTGLVMDERWDHNVKEYGAINITGFRLVDITKSNVQYFLQNWKRLNNMSWPGAGKSSISAQAALVFDVVSVLAEGLSKLVRKKNEGLRPLRRLDYIGINATKPGIECTLNGRDHVTPFEYGEKISKSVRKVQMEGLTGNIGFDDLGRRENYTLSIMEMTVDSDVVKIAEWSDYSGLITVPAKYTRVHTLEGVEAGRTYIVLTILEEPYTMYRKAEPGEILVGNNRFEGYCKDLADLIANKTGIKYELRLVKDGKYGVENPDVPGGFDGVIGELVRKEADIGIAGVTITSSRERVVDFTTPFMELGISIMIKKPVKQKPGFFSFLSPLAEEVWAAVGIVIVFVSLILYLVHRWSPMGNKKKVSPNGNVEMINEFDFWNSFWFTLSSLLKAGSVVLPSRFSPSEWQTSETLHGTRLTNDFNVINSLWFTLGAFMQQGCDISPRSVSGRIVGAVWWFFTLILISSYTANLAAFLTVERMVTPINSADDLAKQTEVEYGTLQAGSTRDFFKFSKIPTYSKMWEFMSSRKHVFVKTYDEGIRRVKQSKGKYALLIESPKNDYVNERQPCDTMKVGQNLDAKGFGVATPLGSPLRERINLAVLDLKENGDLQRLENKWWYERSECSNSDKQETAQNELSLSNVAGIFYILIGGLVLAMVVALIEFIYKSRVEAKRKKIALDDAMKAKARISITGGYDPHG